MPEADGVDAMKVAVVGLGNAGADLHLPALAGLPGVTVCGVFDLDAECRQATAQRLGLRAFADFDRLLGDARPDVVVVATPPGTHVDYCLRSLAGGAHVVCEKPFATSVADADRVLTAAREAGRRVALNHEFRAMPVFHALRDRVGTDGVGDLVALQLWQLMNLPPWKEAGWRGAMRRSSFFEGGIHLLDYALYLFGEPPRSVAAHMSTCGVEDWASDAVTVATLEFSRGRLAHIVQNRLCPGETQYFEVRADCSDASLRASYGGRIRLSAGLHRSPLPSVRVEVGLSGLAWTEHGHRRRVFGRNPRNAPMVATRLLLERTLRAFRAGDSPPADGGAGRLSLEVLAAAYESAETGRRVTLDDETRAALASRQLG